MALSVSCPSCGKRFDNISRKYAGKKAKCSCGEIVRLGSPNASTAGSDSKDSDSDSAPFPDDLMEVDLLGDELLGDALLGDGLLGREQAHSPQENHVKKAQPDAPQENRTASKNRKQNSRRTRKKRSQSQPKPANSAPRDEARESSEKSYQEPVFSQSYSDLDAILDGTGDAAPIVVPPPESEREEDGSDANPGESGSRKRQRSPVGFLSALMSGTLAFWFGVFALVSKFMIIDQLLTSGFSSSLHRMYNGEFSSVELSQTYQVLFLILGWLFWLVVVGLMILGAAQFCNSFYRLLTKRHFFRRIDGTTATCAVVALFLMVGWIFAQASLQRDQHKFLNEYEKPATVNNESLEVVTLLREEVDTQHQSTRNWLLAGALVPMSVFVLSMTRLLTLKPDRQNARSGSKQ